MKIICGSCAITQENKEEALELAKMPEVWGVRCVGLKSVTSFGDRFMGIDREAYFKGESLPSAEIAKEINKLGKVACTEVMTIKQLDSLSGDYFIWNPAQLQHGWFIQEMAQKAKDNDWSVGIKNGKWYGDVEAEIDGVPLTNMEKTWYGHSTFAEMPVTYIQRGIDLQQKGNYRYVPSHNSAKRIKQLTKQEMLFDPSHTYGSKMRDEILEKTVETMKLKMDDGSWLYDGIFIEVGTSPTDTGQHITIEEFKQLIKELK